MKKLSIKNLENINGGIKCWYVGAVMATLNPVLIYDMYIVFGSSAVNSCVG
ncbi:hypothetical protein C1638_007990 [Chryseobacterium oncorhynchi]|uniref:Bacteriocin n=1 Tax=Chryseobacterium oncorhynchi TaxID=741074 RepID=A0A316WYB9_9FLAO|nr:hypothetical protein C1638_007990 [Chryseobacterium oncorhynchi]